MRRMRSFAGCWRSWIKNIVRVLLNYDGGILLND